MGASYLPAVRAATNTAAESEYVCMYVCMGPADTQRRNATFLALLADPARHLGESSEVGKDGGVQRSAVNRDDHGDGGFAEWGRCAAWW